jgi:late competence protein required for DNA uptake (superfamily II DNA/RNA helicase)
MAAELAGNVDEVFAFAFSADTSLELSVEIERPEL